MSDILEISVTEIPTSIVAQTDDRSVIFVPRVEADTRDIEKGRQALLTFMCGESEMRWCAGWLHDLHFALLGSSSFEWLVQAVGGWWEWNPDGKWNVEEGKADPPFYKFVEGTLDELRAKAQL